MHKAGRYFVKTFSSKDEVCGDGVEAANPPSTLIPAALLGSKHMSFHPSASTFAACLAAATLALSPIGAVQAQQPGTEATGAMGSKVDQMKPDCPTTTASGEKQREHAPTAAMDKQVPTMTADGECPDGQIATEPDKKKQ
jgi:hypothetical protein